MWEWEAGGPGGREEAPEGSKERLFTVIVIVHTYGASVTQTLWWSFLLINSFRCHVTEAETKAQRGNNSPLVTQLVSDRAKI